MIRLFDWKYFEHYICNMAHYAMQHAIVNPDVLLNYYPMDIVFLRDQDE